MSDKKTTEERFQKFHDENPKVYRLFSELAFKAINRGKKKLSTNMIINVIRWDYYLDVETDDGFRINDHYNPHYSRLFAHDYPDHAEMFEFRILKSKGKHIDKDDIVSVVSNPQPDKDGQYTIA